MNETAATDSAKAGAEGPIRYATVLYDFSKSNDSELSVVANDRVRVIQADDGKGWMMAEYRGQTGVIPANYCELDPEPEAVAAVAAVAPPPPARSSVSVAERGTWRGRSARVPAAALSVGDTALMRKDPPVCAGSPLASAPPPRPALNRHSACAVRLRGSGGRRAEHPRGRHHRDHET